MKSRNIKVVDEHNIDREANIIFGFDLEGSEYVSYWIERDEDSNNVFVSKVVKNLDGTFNLANIEEEFEKESVSRIVKDLISKSVSDEADTLVGDSIRLDNGKTVKFISVSFNKEQRLDVKKTYITTVKKEVTKVSERYYDVVSIEESQLVSEVSESIQDIFPQEAKSVEEKVEETPVIPEPEVVPGVVLTPEVSVTETSNDDFVTFGTETKVSEPTISPVEVSTQEQVGTVVEAITNDSVAETPVVLEKEDVPVLEAPVVEKHEMPEVSMQTVQEEPKNVGPEPIVQTPVVEPVIPESVVVPAAPVVSEPVVAPVGPSVVEPQGVPVNETQPLVFNASKETNLNAALGEVAKDTTIPVENIEVVREFGEESPALNQPVQTLGTPSATIIQPENQTVPAGTATKAGFANSKFFMVVAVAFFLASCIFLGYEVFNYFQLTK